MTYQRCLGLQQQACGGVGMGRYGFNIRTKLGQRVDNILILAASLSDAERRLRQMYTRCEIIERR